MSNQNIAFNLQKVSRPNKDLVRILKQLYPKNKVGDIVSDDAKLKFYLGQLSMIDLLDAWSQGNISEYLGAEAVDVPEQA